MCRSASRFQLCGGSGFSRSSLPIRAAAAASATSHRNGFLRQNIIVPESRGRIEYLLPSLSQSPDLFDFFLFGNNIQFAVFT